MDSKRLSNLIKRPEGPKLDFKLTIDLQLESGRKELAKDVCAIANSKGGRGYIIIGIEDKTKKVVGVEDLGITEEQIQQIITSRSEPPIPVSLEYVDYDKKTLGIINIYDGPHKPYQVRETGAFYIRRGSTTDIMRKQEIIEALQDSLNLNVETFPVVNSSPDALDEGLIKAYFDSKGLAINDENRLELLESASIIHLDKESGTLMATLGGLLVFSKTNSLYIPHNMIRIVNRIEGKAVDDIIVQGDLLDMIDKSEEILRRSLPEEYPVGALHEAVMNAVIYRDYTDYSKEISVIIDSNSVSVVSPGLFADSKSAPNNSYKKRNMWIYEKMVAIDPKDRLLLADKGINRMKKLFKNIGRVIFVNNFAEDSFKVIFPGISRIKHKKS
ncbi:MAG: ATP-binding protein [Firmicutes bacterium]|nr:ATP-binding protein [Bacillota bacterium]